MLLPTALARRVRCQLWPSFPKGARVPQRDAGELTVESARMSIFQRGAPCFA
jgi:hypothetical protein